MTIGEFPDWKIAHMQTVEEIVCRKLEKRAPDELSPKLTIANSAHQRSYGLLFSAAIANGRQSAQTL